MKIEIYDRNENLVFKGVYEYLEWISSKTEKPIFYIAAHTPDLKDAYEIHFYCDNREEVENIIEELEKIAKK